MSSDKSNTLTRAVALLDCFSYERPELGVREAARLIGLSSSTTGRLMAAMKDSGILRQNPTSKAYSLGGKVLSWAGIYTSTLDIRNRALTAMQELHTDTLETISLYVLEGDERVCVERLESPQNVRIVARIGRRLPLYAGSAGKVFLAFMPYERRKEILDQAPLKPFTTKTFIDRQELDDELDRIRMVGYAVSYGEWILEASGVAAPVFDQFGQLAASLTISGPSQRFTEQNVARYIEKVTEVAAQISREMGYTGYRSLERVSPGFA